MKSLRSNFANPTDVVNFLKEKRLADQNCALIIVTGTEGGGVRAPGALAAVTEQGDCAGYISNGCVDADMFAQAVSAIQENTVRTIRYGTGSPFIDIKLPCGGGVDLMLIPNPALDVLIEVSDALSERRSLVLACSKEEGLEIAVDQTPQTAWQGDKFYIRCDPKLRLRIAGRGTEPVALMRAAHALDFDVHLQTPDPHCLEAAKSLGFSAERLMSLSDVPVCEDDPHTAFVMMFHDHDWETELLIEALKGEAFYIGALGGRRTHKARCETLIQSGVSGLAIKRIHGPMGIVRSVRNASFLAVSVLAQIIDLYPKGER